jgi:hypothetical protein
MPGARKARGSRNRLRPSWDQRGGQRVRRQDGGRISREQDSKVLNDRTRLSSCHVPPSGELNTEVGTPKTRRGLGTQGDVPPAAYR